MAKTMTDKIRRLLAAGNSVPEIARRLKVRQQYVYTVRWLDKNKQEKQEKRDRSVFTPDSVINPQVVIETVNHPPHYKAGGIETIDYIEAKDLNYRLGNVIKYVSRAGKKNSDPIEDLEKAAWYLQREIDARKRA